MGSNKVKSHFIQKALLKDILNNKQYAFIYSSNTKSFVKSSLDNVGSKVGLFPVDDEEAKKLEKMMNEFFEQKTYKKIANLDVNHQTIEFTYEEAFLLRKYMLVTFLRTRLQQKIHNDKLKEITKMVSSVTQEDYEYRFRDDLSPIEHYFIKGTYLKIIVHDDVDIIFPNNTFLTFPFDTQNSDFCKIKSIDNIAPGFIMPIGKNISICITSTQFMTEVTSYLIQHSKTFFRFNISNQTMFITNKNKVIDEKGEISNACTLIDNKVDANNLHKKKMEEIKKRYKIKNSYVYEVCRLTSYDWKILVLDNIWKYIGMLHLTNSINDYNIYFTKKEKVASLFKEYIDITNYVESNQPDAVSYWSETKTREYQHKVWELVDDTTINFFNDFLNAKQIIR